MFLSWEMYTACEISCDLRNVMCPCFDNVYEMQDIHKCQEMYLTLTFPKYSIPTVLVQKISLENFLYVSCSFYIRKCDFYSSAGYGDYAGVLRIYCAPTA